jgi:hypothetical protein
MKKFNSFQLIGTLAISIAVVVFLAMRNTTSEPISFAKEISDLRLFDAWSQEIDLSKGYNNVRYFDLPLCSGESAYRIEELAVFGDKLFSIDFQQQYPIKCFNLDNSALLFEIPYSILNEQGIAHPAGFSYDAEGRLVVLGDAMDGRIYFFEENGSLVKSVKIGINFIDFSYSPHDHRFIVYAPQAGSSSNSDFANNSIHIFSEDGQHIKSMSPIHEACQVLNFVASGRFVKDGRRVYFNPPFTGKIYEVSYDGQLAEVYDAPFSGIGEEEIQSWMARVASGDDLNLAFVNSVLGEMPFEKFLITDEFVLFEKKFNSFPHSIVVDRDSGKSVVVGQRMRLPKSKNDNFNFFFNEPLSASNGSFLSYFSKENVNRIIGNNNPGFLMGGKGSRIERMNEDLLMIYDLNFEFLYQHSTSDLSTLIAKQQGDGLKVIRQPLNWFKVSPNPTSGIVKVETRGAADIYLYSLEGQLENQVSVRSQPGVLSISEIELNRLQPGIYVVKVVSQDEHVFDSKTIIVTR